MKKICIVFILIFSLFLFIGNDKDDNFQLDNDYIMLSIAFDGSGSVSQAIDFSVNSKKIKKLSNSDEEYFEFVANLVKEVENIRNEFLFSFALKYMQNPIELYKINKGVILSNVIYSSESDSIGFNINFSSVEAWNYYHASNASEENVSKNNKNGNIFYRKIQSNSQNPFASYVKVNENESVSVGNRYRQKYISSASGLSFENNLNIEYKPDFIYNYCSPYSKLHSNAHFNLKNSNGYYHIWQVKYDELNKENIISFWIISINYGWLYLITLLIVLLAVIISLIIHYIKCKNKINIKTYKEN